MYFNIATGKEATVECIPCNTTITLGKSYKALSNIHAHCNSKRPSHEQAITRWQDKEAKRLLLGKDSPQIKKKLDNLKAQKEIFKCLKEQHG